VFSILRTLIVVLLSLLLLSVGCSKKTATSPVSYVPDYVVTCVGVLPVAIADNFDEIVPAAEKKQLQNGVQILNELLKQQFISRPDVRLVSDGQISGMDENLPAKSLARARVVADRLSCNTVLETTLRRYKDRVGGKFFAKDPASVAFDFRLIAIPEGTVLCSGTFDEVQQSVMENLFNFKNATERGFTWVTAEQLMREGLRARFSECPYLADDE
jgi:hypothetical protein